MKLVRQPFSKSGSDLRAALSCIRQAALCLPEEMEEIGDDLRWVEESLVAAIQEQDEQECVSEPILFSHSEGMGA